MIALIYAIRKKLFVKDIVIGTIADIILAFYLSTLIDLLRR